MGLRENILSLSKIATMRDEDQSHDLVYLLESSVDVDLDITGESVNFSICEHWAFDIASKTNKLPPQPSVVCFFHGRAFPTKYEGLICWEDRLLECYCAKNVYVKYENGAALRATVTPTVSINVQDGCIHTGIHRDETRFREYRDDDWHSMQESLASRYLQILGLLSLKQTSVEHKAAPKSLNARRAKKGKPPINERVIVRLTDAAISASKGGTHASPRPHWRRGHVRRLADGKIVMVSPHAVMGYAEQKDYTFKV